MKLHCLLFLCTLFFLLSCKRPITNSAGTQSITPRGQVVGKWLAAVSVGGGVEKSATEILATTLKDVFLSEQGGGYKLAFDLADTSGWRANKGEILKRFSSLKADISAFKAQKPDASTMVVISLTGHGFSRDVFVDSSAGYVFQVGEGPDNFFTGVELANQIAALNADEVLVFVQSCNSGSLSNVEFMNRYAQELANESSRKRLNVAVITPVSSVIFSPLFAIEKALSRTFAALQSGAGDFGTYAQFKNTFVREVCSDSSFYPRAQIRNLSAVQSVVSVSSENVDKIPQEYQSYIGVETLSGIDPQFYEFIDPNLPLVLTRTGLEKYRADSIQFPQRLAPSTNVPVSPETLQFCNEQISKRKERFAALEQIRVQILKYLQQ